MPVLSLGLRFGFRVSGSTLNVGVSMLNPDYDEVRMVEIPWPMVRPLWWPLSAGSVKEVWDTFVKPMQAADVPASIEERCLMAILRSVYDGLARAEAADSGTP